jgi:hypothetical protein
VQEFNAMRSDAQEAADDMVRNFQGEILDQLLESGKASDDVNNDYPDGDAYHHETHVDRDYSLTEAAELLDELAEYEETDSGLWEGLAPREAISAQAAYTFGQAVWCLWSDRIKEINDDDAIQEILESHNAIENPTEEQTQAARSQLDARISEILS